jgi:flavodoxin
MAKKVLVVFYSRNGNTKKAGEAIAKELNCDVEQIMDVKSRMGLFGWLRSGMEAVKEILPLIQETKKDLSAYDLVIIGTPVWGDRMSSPIRTYISKNKERFKQAAFFITHGGEGNTNVFVGMEQLSGKKPLAILDIISAQIKDGKYLEKVKEFVAKVN